MGISTKTKSLTLPGLTDKIDAFVFDLDGTLYPKNAVRKAMIRSLFPRLITLKKYNDARNSVVGRDFHSSEVMLDTIVSLFSKDNGRKAAKLRSWLDSDYYPALLECIATIPPRDGFPELIHRLYQHGIKLAVVSDYGYVRERLQSLGFDVSCFSLLLGTEEEGMMKPATRINEIIFAELGTIPSRTVMVGDRDDTDRALADAAGMPFLGICDGECLPDAGQNWYSWLALKALLEKLL